jgi:hypothetical protein
MALSQSVTDSLKEAEYSLRNALAYAARTERPSTAKNIAELIHNIDMLIRTDELLDHIDDMKQSLKDNN